MNFIPHAFPRKALYLAIFCCLNLGVFCAPSAQAAALTPASEAQTSSGEDNINRFIDTIAVIKKEYALKVDDKKLLENAIRGMVSNLDPHSEYLDEDAYKSLITSTSGEFGGLGIEVTSEYGVLKVISPIDDTPASRAGIKSGDYIVALNNNPVNEMTADQAITTMRGAKGSKVDITVIRKNVKDPIKFSLVRAIIHIDSVKSRMLDGNIGYVRISQFQQPTAGLLKSAIEALQKQADGKLKGMILDLRNNPGGLLESAVGVVNLFLDSDKITKFNRTIVYTEGRVPEAQYKASATGSDLLKGMPLIVLLNDGSASASEIVAGALQDYHRAVIVGETSFGKGSVQTVLPLDQTHAIKLTTALYHTPSGRIIQNLGITPDIFIANVKVTDAKAATGIDQIREMQLKGNLSNPYAAARTDVSKEDLTKLAAEDFQLYESMNILQAIALGNLNLKP